MAHPVGILASEAELLAYLDEVGDELAGVVVGLPRNMDGTYGPMARRSLELVQRLRAARPFRFVLWDERLTTQAARRISAAGEEVDHRAAAILLQSFLEAGSPEKEDPDMGDPDPSSGSKAEGS